MRYFRYIYSDCGQISTSWYLHAKTRGCHTRLCGIYESVRTTNSRRKWMKAIGASRLWSGADVRPSFDPLNWRATRLIERAFEIRCVRYEYFSEMFRRAKITRNHRFVVFYESFFKKKLCVFSRFWHYIAPSRYNIIKTKSNKTVVLKFCIVQTNNRNWFKWQKL